MTSCRISLCLAKIDANTEPTELNNKFTSQPLTSWLLSSFSIRSKNVIPFLSRHELKRRVWYIFHLFPLLHYITTPLYKTKTSPFTKGGISFFLVSKLLPLITFLLSSNFSFQKITPWKFCYNSEKTWKKTVIKPWN